MKYVPQRPFDSFYRKWEKKNKKLLNSVTNNILTTELISLVKKNKKHIFYASIELRDNYNKIIKNEVYNSWVYAFYPEYHTLNNRDIYITLRFENDKLVHLWLPKIITYDKKFLNYSLFHNPRLVLNINIKNIKLNLIKRCINAIDDSTQICKLFQRMPKFLIIQLVTNSKNI